MVEYNAGDAKLRIVPDASNFKKELEAKLKSVKTDFAVRVSVELAQAKADLERFRAQQRANAINIPVDVDTNQIRRAASEIEKTKREASKPIKTQLELDVQKAENELRALRIREEAKKLGIKVDVDTAQAELQLRLLRAQAEARKITLRLDADTSGVSAKISKLGSELGSAFGGLADIGKTIGITGLVANIPAAITAVAALGQALGQLSGAALAVPGGIATAVASIGTLAIGLSGITDAYSAVSAASAESTTGMGERARAAASATTALRNAVVDETQAQKDVAIARKDARQELIDLNLEMRGGQISIKQAENDAAKARRDLAKGGFKDALDRRDAELRVEETVQRVAEAYSRQAELATKKSDADAKGVDGSDRVVAANERLIRSQQGVASAQQALTDATGTSIAAADKAADALAKLSPQAAAFVNTLVSLKPKWVDLKKTVSGNLFEGASVSFTQFVDKVLPGLKAGMGSIATAWNSNIKQLLSSLGSDHSKGLLDRILGNTAQAQNNFTKAIDPIVRGVSTLAAAGSDAIPRLATAIGSVAQRFATFIDAADKDGRLDKWINEGLTGFTNLGNILINLGKSFTSITDAVGGPGLLKSLSDLTGKWASFLASTKGQQDLRNFFREGREEIDKLKPVIKGLIDTVPAIWHGAKAAWEVFRPGLELFLSLLRTSPGLITDIVAGFAAWKVVDGVVTLTKSLQAINVLLGTTIPASAKTGAASAGLSMGALAKTLLPIAAFLVLPEVEDIARKLPGDPKNFLDRNNLATPDTLIGDLSAIIQGKDPHSNAGKVVGNIVHGRPAGQGLTGSAQSARDKAEAARQAAINSAATPSLFAPPVDPTKPVPVPSIFGVVPGYDSGGPTGAGLAVLHPNEFVLSARASKYPMGFKHALNEGRIDPKMLPHFDNGGEVGRGADNEKFNGAWGGQYVPWPRGTKPFSGIFNPNIKIDTSTTTVARPADRLLQPNTKLGGAPEDYSDYLGWFEDASNYRRIQNLPQNLPRYSTGGPFKQDPNWAAPGDPGYVDPSTVMQNPLYSRGTPHGLYDLHPGAEGGWKPGLMQPSSPLWTPGLSLGKLPQFDKGGPYRPDSLGPVGPAPSAGGVSAALDDLIAGVGSLNIPLKPPGPGPGPGPNLPGLPGSSPPPFDTPGKTAPSLSPFDPPAAPAPSGPSIFGPTSIVPAAKPPGPTPKVTDGLDPGTTPTPPVIDHGTTGGAPIGPDPIPSNAPAAVTDPAAPSDTGPRSPFLQVWQNDDGTPKSVDEIAAGLPDKLKPFNIANQFGQIALGFVAGFFGLDTSYLQEGSKVFDFFNGKQNGGGDGTGDSSGKDVYDSAVASVDGVDGATGLLNPASRASTFGGKNTTYSPSFLQSKGIAPLYTRSVNAKGENVANIPAWATQLGAKFNLTPTSHVDSTLHGGAGASPGGGWAFDYSGKPEDEQRFADFIKTNLRGQTLQLIWQNPNTGEQDGIAGGQILGHNEYYTDPGGTYADHTDHVHWATDVQPNLIDPATGKSLLDNPQGGNQLSAANASGSKWFGGSGDLKKRAHQAYLAAGMPPNEWDDFDSLIQHESSWQPTIKNPGSTAYGLGQFLDSTWASVGGAKTDDPLTQLQYVFAYLKQRPDYHGSPSAAWSLWQSRTPHWYDSGGWLQPGLTMARNDTGKPEAVLTHEQGRALQAMAPHFADGGPYKLRSVIPPPPPPPLPRGPQARPKIAAPIPAPAPAVPPAPAAPAPIAAPPPAPDQFAPPQTPDSASAPRPGAVTGPGGESQAGSEGHLLPAIGKAIDSTASTIGNAANTAAAIGTFGIAGALGGGAGGGGGGISIGGVIQQAGKIVKGIAEVGASFLVGNVTPGTVDGKAYGETYKPQQKTPQTAPLNGESPGRNYIFNGIDSRNVVDEMRLKDAQDAQAVLARW